ncbi:hypothetical protein BDR06DRAFT_977246 [Suillus hirtellus]|nr:hypothetical protein BDR06DRAFT_977246 [Suillus hirtellus]
MLNGKKQDEQPVCLVIEELTKEKRGYIVSLLLSMEMQRSQFFLVIANVKRRVPKECRDAVSVLVHQFQLYRGSAKALMALPETECIKEDISFHLSVAFYVLKVLHKFNDELERDAPGPRAKWRSIYVDFHFAMALEDNSFTNEKQTLALQNINRTWKDFQRKKTYAPVQQLDMAKMHAIFCKDGDDVCGSSRIHHVSLREMIDRVIKSHTACKQEGMEIKQKKLTLLKSRGEHCDSNITYSCHWMDDREGETIDHHKGNGIIKRKWTSLSEESSSQSRTVPDAKRVKSSFRSTSSATKDTATPTYNGMTPTTIGALEIGIPMTPNRSSFASIYSGMSTDTGKAQTDYNGSGYNERPEMKDILVNFEEGASASLHEHINVPRSNVVKDNSGSERESPIVEAAPATHSKASQSISQSDPGRPSKKDEEFLKAGKCNQAPRPMAMVGDCNPCLVVSPKYIDYGSIALLNNNKNLWLKMKWYYRRVDLQDIYVDIADFVGDYELVRSDHMSLVDMHCVEGHAIIQTYHEADLGQSKISPATLHCRWQIQITFKAGKFQKAHLSEMAGKFYAVVIVVMSREGYIPTTLNSDTAGQTVSIVEWTQVLGQL